MRLLLVGDLVLDEPDAPFFFDHVRDTLKTADLVVGHVETPHTDRGAESVGDVPAPASPPENIAALGQAGFGIATLAGNHIHDRGGEGSRTPSPCSAPRASPPPARAPAWPLPARPRSPVAAG